MSVARLGCLALLFWYCLVSVGQASQLESHATRTSLWSETLREWRGVIVRLPDSYDESRQTYPVVYLLDGDVHYYHVAGVTQFLANNHQMPEVIVVAVPNSVVTRARDLTPPSAVAAETRDGTGGADRFLAFLTRKLRPWVEQHYRTVPFNILIGHSYGGLFALHTLHTRAEAFSAYLALDPSLWYNRQSLVHDLPQSVAEEGLAYYAARASAGNDFLDLQRQVDTLRTKAPEPSHAH